jgi:hypothetical protein
MERLRRRSCGVCSYDEAGEGAAVCAEELDAKGGGLFGGRPNLPMRNSSMLRLSAGPMPVPPGYSYSVSSRSSSRSRRKRIHHQIWVLIIA